MPKLDPASTAWGRLVAGSVRSQVPLRRALRRTISVAREEPQTRHLRVMVLGPAGSGRSSLLAVVRRLALSTGCELSQFRAGTGGRTQPGVDCYEDQVGSPSAARVAWQVVPDAPEAQKDVTKRMREALARHDNPKPELVVILTKKPEKPEEEISEGVDLIDVLTWATETNK